MKNDVIKRLRELPGEIQAQENALLEAVQYQEAYAESLSNTEAGLLLSGIIDGKNAEIRAAQMKDKTAEERAKVKEAENLVANARIGLNALLNELKALQAIARLLDREVA